MRSIPISEAPSNKENEEEEEEEEEAETGLLPAFILWAEIKI